jgi:cytochrome c-type biogenesis protein CcmE
MKKTHLFMLVLIAGAIATLLVFFADFSTYETINSAKGKMGKSVTIIAKLDKSKPMEYDPVKNANYFTFYAKDSLGGSTKVIYHDSKPTDFERSEQITLTGHMANDSVFECKKILLKCPSKYKNDKNSIDNPENQY